MPYDHKFGLLGIRTKFVNPHPFCYDVKFGVMKYMFEILRKEGAHYKYIDGVLVRSQFRKLTRDPHYLSYQLKTNCTVLSNKQWQLFFAILKILTSKALWKACWLFSSNLMSMKWVGQSTTYICNLCMLQVKDKGGFRAGLWGGA